MINNLTIRGLDTDGSILDMQKRLKDQLKIKHELYKLQLQIEHGTRDEKTIHYLLLNALPCILHLENCTGLKIITRLLRIGIDNAKNNKLAYCTERGETTNASIFLKKIQTTVNTKILGAVDRPSTWKCSYDQETRNVGTISMDNVRTRKLITDIDLLIDDCIPKEVDNNEASREVWKTWIKNYCVSLDILLVKEDLTDDQIMSYQWALDLFFQQWIDINKGKEGVTNYIHLIGSGHISEYLFEWRNLYEHSQQGWENLNNVVKKYYFRRTPRGGGVVQITASYQSQNGCHVAFHGCPVFLMPR